jgi:hypothetical protein
LAFLGGASNVLLHITADKLKPDIKTFSQILGSTPKNDKSEKVIKVIGKVKIVVHEQD